MLLMSLRSEMWKRWIELILWRSLIRCLQIHLLDILRLCVTWVVYILYKAAVARQKHQKGMEYPLTTPPQFWGSKHNVWIFLTYMSHLLCTKEENFKNSVGSFNHSFALGELTHTVPVRHCWWELSMRLHYAMVTLLNMDLCSQSVI